MKKSSLRVLSMTMMLIFTACQLYAQSRYTSYSELVQKIGLLTREFPSLCSAKPLVKTAGGKEIWVITIGNGNRDTKPGIVVAGGIEGSHVLGKELALGFAESLLKESSLPEIKKLLDEITFYIFPDVSPDATEQFFSGIKYERDVNARSTDDDRDFVFDEDQYEDINSDGYITLIRIKDPSGGYIQSSDDKRVMVPAKLEEGQKGEYLIISEGIDNDKDGAFNEDGAGGVNFNKNFTYNYEEFGMNAGLYPISEPESKAVADFLFDRYNVYTVFLFGPQDNLGEPMKYSDRQEGARKVTSIMKTDETVNRLVSDKYHAITGVKGAPVSKAGPGNFMDWAYFHYGRYCFSTPAWWIASEKGKAQEITFLKRYNEQNINKVFVPWQEVSHPDFPGKKAEVGGIKPFVLKNPPPDSLVDLINKNYRFVTDIAAMHPALEFLDLETENKGEDIFRVSIKIHNKGIFATCAEIGENNNWTRIMRISIEPGDRQSLLSGQKIQRVNRLEGDQSAIFSWLIKGKGNIRITAGAINTGTIVETIVLK